MGQHTASGAREIKIILIHNGKEHEYSAPEGSSLMEVVSRHIDEYSGTCGGSLACSTCHLIIADDAYFKKLAKASDDEEDMLDLAWGVSPNSRLGCQIILNEALDGIKLIVPEQSRNLSV